MRPRQNFQEIPESKPRQAVSTSPNILLHVHYYEPKSEKRGFYALEHTNSDNLGYMDKGTEAGSTPTTWTTRETRKRAPACLV